MSVILQQLKKITEALHESGAPWALIGGLAVSVYATARTTRDIDVAVVIRDNKEQDDLLAFLATRGFSSQQMLMHVMPTQKLGVRVNTPQNRITELPLDLLFSSSGIEEEVVDAAKRIEVLPRMYIPVACRGHLIAMKVVSEDSIDRIQDRIDLRALLESADAQDLKMASEGLRLIEERGFNRGKDLPATLKKFLDRFTPKVEL